MLRPDELDPAPGNTTILLLDLCKHLLYHDRAEPVIIIHLTAGCFFYDLIFGFLI